MKTKFQQIVDFLEKANPNKAGGYTKREISKATGFSLKTVSEWLMFGLRAYTVNCWVNQIRGRSKWPLCYFMTHRPLLSA